MREQFSTQFKYASHGSSSCIGDQRLENPAFGNERAFSTDLQIDSMPHVKPKPPNQPGKLVVNPAKCPVLRVTLCYCDVARPGRSQQCMVREHRLPRPILAASRFHIVVHQSSSHRHLLLEIQGRSLNDTWRAPLEPASRRSPSPAKTISTVKPDRHSTCSSTPKFMPLPSVANKTERKAGLRPRTSRV